MIILYDTITWIEGIGSLQGLLDYNEGGTSLLCFKHASDIMYLNTYGFDCNYAGPVDYVETMDKSEVCIYPNPFKNNVTVKSLKQIKQIIIYDIKGEKLYQFYPVRDVFQLDLNSLKSGLYIIKIDDNFRKLIKE